jgi:putative transposase
MAHRIPVTRACGCAGLARSAYYEEPVNWIVRDAEIVAALARLIEEHPSRGFWKCYQRLRLEGFGWNHKRIYRVYCTMKPQPAPEGQAATTQAGTRTALCAAPA